MIDLRDVPTPRPVSPARRDADLALLRATVQGAPAAGPRPRRRLVLIAGTTAGALVVVGGVAAAGVVLSGRGADVHDVARCYSAVSSDFGDGFPGTSVSVASRPGDGSPDVAAQAVEACSAVWAAGLFEGAAATLEPGQKSPTLPTDGVVPELTACVLPSGEAAVFPGPAATCTSLGLAPLVES